MAMQVKDSRNGEINTPSSSGEEGLVKTLIRGLVRTGGIYADARMAADQELNPEKREMREYAAEKAKSALLEDIAAANGYIEVLKGKVEESRNGSNAKAGKEEEAATEETDLQQAIRENDEELTGDEAEPTVEEAPPELEDESSRVPEEEAGAAEAEETETEDTATQEEGEEIVEETESVEEMFGLAQGTADAISELLFSGSQNAIEPNERLNKRNLEKIALVLDALDIDEAEIKDRTEAFLRHKGFDDEVIIEETIEAVLNLWKGYQQDDDPPEEEETEQTDNS